MGLLAGGGAALLSSHRAAAQSSSFNIAQGPFAGTRESLSHYEVPKWFRDAKFGIWAHWGPQSAIEYGDWYARLMYIEGSPQYKYHLEHYGHPSKVGYKDTIPNWKAARWDPEHLIGLYKKAGAKYFMSMGVHHDNFDLWNSKYTRWNALKMGPKQDVVGRWRRAARNAGLPFGVSDHLWITYKWFSVSHGADANGAMAGVPYDGANPAYADLYCDSKTIYKDLPWNEDGIPEAWKQTWYRRIKDLVDNYAPDLLYADGHIPFEDYGLNQVANLYNLSARRNGGVSRAIYFSKRPEDCETGTCARDVERGIPEDILHNPWQTDTCIGEWHYKRDIDYKSPKTVVDMLVDVVCRNGNLLLNFPLPNSGELDSKELAVLSAITDWMAINGEAIHGTRPWKTFGYGPSTVKASSDAKFNESKRKALTAEEVRFTTKAGTLYAFLMGWPEGDVTVEPLGSAGKVSNVELLGRQGSLEWKQDQTGLHVKMPSEKPCDYAVALKISGAV